MESDNSPQPAEKELKIKEYHRLEIQEIFTRLREMINLRIQVASILGSANLVVLGIAFNVEKVGLILIAPATLVLLIMVDRVVLRRSINALYYRGLQLEQMYAPKGERALLQTYGAVTANQTITIELIQKMSIIPKNHQEFDKHIATLRKFSPGIAGFWFPLIVVFGEVILAILLWISGWKFI